jgi:hypothetical protein
MLFALLGGPIQTADGQPDLCSSLWKSDTYQTRSQDSAANLVNPMHRRAPLHPRYQAARFHE